MRHYIDKVLAVDSSHSYERLGWSPDPNFHIERRLPFLIDLGKSKTHLWWSRNIERVYRDTKRPSFWIFRELLRLKNDVLCEIASRLVAGIERPASSLFQALDEMAIRRCAESVIDLLLGSIWTGERMKVTDHIEKMGFDFLRAGFSSSDMITTCNSCNVCSV